MAQGLATTDGERIAAFTAHYGRIRSELARRIVGQEKVIEEVFIALLSEGHVLIIGVPGLAKTLLVRSIAELLSLDFKRIQFTPDLMPSDITGGSIIADDPSSGERGFHFTKGPIFANIVLADEINRTPPKTQAALMEAMEERQVTVGTHRYPLDSPFFVMATQNPIEQEGTYPLPVSQLDRFMLNILIDYPEFTDEYEILTRTTTAYRSEFQPLVSADEIRQMLGLVREVQVSPDLLRHAMGIARATRPGDPSAPEPSRECLAWGAGVRATQAIIAGARAYAMMNGRCEVRLEDIHRVAYPALRHRLIRNYHADAEGIPPDEVVTRILESLPDAPHRRPSAPVGLLGRAAAMLRGKGTSRSSPRSPR